LKADDRPPRRLHFELRGDMQEVMQKVGDVEAFALETGCSATSAQQMKLVAEELFINVIRHAWPGRDPGHCIVDVTASDQQDGVHVSLRIEDDGIAFDPLAAASPDLDVSLDERQFGGVGILLVTTMTDHQAYRREQEHNILEVFKVCPRASA
jgi:serine/threonine-protein kinase RsbW